MANIGIIDSGIGGLSVLKAIVSKTPNNRFMYLADILNAPYGEKSKAEIIDYTKICCDKLLAKGADIIVLACNTATSGAIDEMRNLYDIPIIGTEPNIAGALRDNRKKILVMATPFTLESERYHNLIKDKRDKLVNLPCNNLSERIDNVAPYYDKMSDEIYNLLIPYKDCEAIVLGCTHYALIKDIISRILPVAHIYSSARGIAKRIENIINDNNLQEEENCIHMLSTSNINMTRYIELFNQINDY